MLLGPILLTPGSLWRHLAGEAPDTLRGRTQAPQPPQPSSRRTCFQSRFHVGGGVPTQATKSRLMKFPPGLITALPDQSTPNIQTATSSLNDPGAGEGARCLYLPAPSWSSAGKQAKGARWRPESQICIDVHPSCPAPASPVSTGPRQLTRPQCDVGVWRLAQSRSSPSPPGPTQTTQGCHTGSAGPGESSQGQ